MHWGLLPCAELLKIYYSMSSKQILLQKKYVKKNYELTDVVTYNL